jgi:hypothetical protein
MIVNGRERQPRDWHPLGRAHYERGVRRVKKMGTSREDQGRSGVLTMWLRVSAAGKTPCGRWLRLRLSREPMARYLDPVGFAGPAWAGGQSYHLPPLSMRDTGLGSTEIGSTCCPGQVSG